MTSTTPKIKRYTWADFDQDVKWFKYNLTKRATDLRLKYVYGERRGGLPLAVAMSHALELPMCGNAERLRNPHHVLWCDDIVDSGKAITENGTYNNVVLVLRADARWPTIKHLTYGRIESSRDWILFPWENAERAISDFEAYQTRAQQQPGNVSEPARIRATRDPLP